jgi:hypothetical protein
VGDSIGALHIPISSPIMIIKAVYYALYAFSRLGSFVQVGDARLRRYRAVLCFSLVQAWTLEIIATALALLTSFNLFHLPKWEFVAICLSTVPIPWCLVNWEFDHYCSVFSGISPQRRLRYDILVALVAAVIFATMILMLKLYRETH